MKEVYLIAVETDQPLSSEELIELLGGDDVDLRLDEPNTLASIITPHSRVDVHFETPDKPLGWTPELITGAPEAREAFEHAPGFYRVHFQPGVPQGSVSVFEALWVVRSIVEVTEGVVLDSTSYKLHLPQDIEEITELDFDIRDHVTIHASDVLQGEKSYWIHTHGMAKFGVLDVEMFHIGEEELPAAESFFHELCTDLAFDHGPELRNPIATSVGMGFMLLPSDEARANLYGLEPEVFEGHEGKFCCVVNPEGRHSISEILAHYNERFEEETADEAQALLDYAKQNLTLFKARFQRKGLMEPLSFLVRAPFEVHPGGENGGVEEEMLWAEVLSWDDETLIGKIIDGGTKTTEWRKGAHAEIDESQINAIAVSREGRTLDPDEMGQLLKAELPA